MLSKADKIVSRKQLLNMDDYKALLTGVNNSLVS